MVLSAVFGGRRLPLTQLTPLVLTPLLTTDELLALCTTNAENYWILALATLKARWYATIRYRQCCAEAEEQAREQRLQQQAQHDALVVANRLAYEAGNAMRRLVTETGDAMHNWRCLLDEERAQAERPVDAQYLEYLMRDDDD